MIKTLDLIGMPIITINLGENLGKVKDVLIDPTKLELAALVLPSSLFSQDTMVVPRTVIQVYGRDAILVKSNEAMVRDNTLPGVASLLSIGKLKGRPIATEKGFKVGVLNDLIIDGTGQIVGYDLARVFIKGPVAQSKRLPVNVTRSIGPDLIIVDARQLDLIK